jgi:hypothetical protein
LRITASLVYGGTAFSRAEPAARASRGAAALAAAVRPQPGARLEGAAVQAWLREDSGKIFKRRPKQPWWEGSGRRI